VPETFPMVLGPFAFALVLVMLWHQRSAFCRLISTIRLVHRGDSSLIGSVKARLFERFREALYAGISLLFFAVLFAVTFT